MAFGFTACREPQKEKNLVTLSVRNVSTNSLRGVELVWEGPRIPVGVLFPGVDKTSVDVPWPNIDKGNISFIDASTRELYTLEISFTAVNERVRAGRCGEIVIRILDTDKADAVCE